jgi:hypothetical protein
VEVASASNGFLKEHMMDPATVAAAAIAAAIPYLAAFGKEAAKGLAGGVGKSVWDWV